MLKSGNKRRKVDEDILTKEVGRQARRQGEKIQEVRELILSEIRRRDGVEQITNLKNDVFVNNKKMNDLISNLKRYKMNQEELDDLNKKVTDSENKYLKGVAVLENSEARLDNLIERVKRDNGYFHCGEENLDNLGNDVDVDELVDFAGRLRQFVAPAVPAPQPIIHLNDFTCSLYKQ